MIFPFFTALNESSWSMRQCKCKINKIRDEMLNNIRKKIINLRQNAAKKIFLWVLELFPIVSTSLILTMTCICISVWLHIKGVCIEFLLTSRNKKTYHNNINCSTLFFFNNFPTLNPLQYILAHHQSPVLPIDKQHWIFFWVLCILYSLKPHQ